MSVKRFFSASSLEAIKQVRAELGDEAVIFSNSEVDGGVDVIASAQDDVTALIDRRLRSAKPPSASLVGLSAFPTIARKAHAAHHRQSTPIVPAAPVAARDAQPLQPKSSKQPVTESFAHFIKLSESTRMARTETLLEPAKAAQSIPVPAVAAVARQLPVISAESPQIMAEIPQMKSILQEQTDILSWWDKLARRPLQAKQISQLLSCGFVPANKRVAETARRFLGVGLEYGGCIRRDAAFAAADRAQCSVYSVALKNHAVAQISQLVKSMQTWRLGRYVLNEN